MRCTRAKLRGTYGAVGFGVAEHADKIVDRLVDRLLGTVLELDVKEDIVLEEV